MQNILTIALAFLIFLAPNLAVAQEAMFSNEQIMLNNQAVEATKAGDYSKAEQLFKAILQIEEFNVVWLNLGRAYASQDKCIEALEAYSQVKIAPATSEIPVEIVNSKLDEYVLELEEQCSAQVIIECIPAEMKISIDGGKDFQCSSNPIALTPGQHSLQGRASFGINTKVFDAQVGGPNTVTLEVVNFEQMAKDAAVTPEARARRSKIYKSIGYSFIGVGAAAVLGGGLLMPLSDAHYKDKLQENKEGTSCPTACINDERKKARTRLNTSYGLLAAGGAVLVTGIALVVVDAVKFSDKPKKSASFELMPSAIISNEYQGLSIVGRF